MFIYLFILYNVLITHLFVINFIYFIKIVKFVVVEIFVRYNVN